MPEDAAIIIFVRHPGHGKVKTRLAATIGNDKALAVYRFLLKHTHNLIKKIPIPVYIYYEGTIVNDDLWKGDNIYKKLQIGKDLGEKMANAFLEVFERGYHKVVIIGSDCYELDSATIMESFKALNDSDIVLGPARDGGYYLLGMNAPFKNVFKNIEWSTPSVFSKTVEQINQYKYRFTTLPVLTDVDTEDDINFSY